MTTAPETAGAFRVCEREIPAVLSTAHAVAEAARRETLRHFRSNTLVRRTNKAEPGDVRSFDPVTIADRAAEAAMRAVLAERRPQDAILGEEADDVPGESGLTWVLDPIDGTRGFIAGTPTWGVLIALCDAEGPIYGIIDQPYIGERFEGGLGRARLTGPRGARPLSVEPAASLAEATLFTTFPRSGPRRTAPASRWCATR
jgi:fructose-1,6-bisphosphatase/inositol monophosphatase family enzyme